MARQKKILDKAHLRSRPRRDDAAWQLAWKKRFYAFIDDLKETLTKYGAEATLTPSLVKAWQAEWMRIGQDSHFKDSPVPQPPGYPLWLPDFERKTEYLRAIENAAKRELQHGTLLSSVTADLRGKLIRRIMKKAHIYCQQVDKARKAQRGIKREKAKPEQLKHIVWAVQYQVMKIDPKEIAEQSIADEAAVNKTIRAILKTIYLPSRGEPGRSKGKRTLRKVDFT
jgi:hypothetical protein